MDNPYIPPLAVPVFTKFVEAEQACDIAWENVKDARTMADRKVALENFREVQAMARDARAFYHKCERAVIYEDDNQTA